MQTSKLGFQLIYKSNIIFKNNQFYTSFILCPAVGPINLKLYNTYNGTEIHETEDKDVITVNIPLNNGVFISKLAFSFIYHEDTNLYGTQIFHPTTNIYIIKAKKPKFYIITKNKSIKHISKDKTIPLGQICKCELSMLIIDKATNDPICILSKSETLNVRMYFT